ncbi:MAG: hypothetical protein JW976_11105 [Syntrophaceae bacterium]|nr:hypothetical protein [Syntrophaceae bacterium]
MIKLSKAIYTQTLLLLICFAIFSFLPGCGGSGGGDGAGGGGEAEVTYTLTVTTSPDVLTFKAGETVTITANVIDNSTGLAASGQAVTFTIYRNNSGGTLEVQGTGTTDASGNAEAVWTFGSNTPDEQVSDIFTVSIPDSTQTVTVTREAGAATQVDAASLDIEASPTSIKTDNSTFSTITVNALNAGNALLSGVGVTLTADTGILSAGSLTTPGNVTLTSGSNRTNRTATVTATSGEITTQIPVQIVGSTVTIASGSSSISTTGSTTLTITVKDAGSNVVSGATVELTQSSSSGGRVTFGADTGTTNANGIFTTTANGNTNGTVTITASALGATASTALTITSGTTSVFEIDRQRKCTTAACTFSVVTGNPNPTAMYLTQTLEIRVNAPGAIANVRFATTQGTFTDSSNAANTGSAITVTVGNVEAGKATAYLTTTQAGIATINVYNSANLSTNDSLSVFMTSATANSITLQATPNVVSTSVGTTTGSSTLVAMVRDINGAPVGNAPVLFTIVNPTGGGETISPVVVMTAKTTTGGLNLGEARSSFISGSLPTAAGGVYVRASVIGTTVATEAVGLDITPSGNDAAIIIGGVAGSIAFGMATTLDKDDSRANYTLEMSALVSDANGNPAPAGTIVTLSLWPIAWSTGGGCSYDADDDTDYALVDENYTAGDDDDDDGIPGTDPKISVGTFCNEDQNENLFLDTGEDGTRLFYASNCTIPAIQAAPTVDGYITAVNSAAGTVPASVTTDENGVAHFTMTYPITSSIWTIVRLRGSTIVQGTETVGQVIWRLAATSADIGPPCAITGSLYNY